MFVFVFSFQFIHVDLSKTKVKGTRGLRPSPSLVTVMELLPPRCLLSKADPESLSYYDTEPQGALLCFHVI